MPTPMVLTVTSGSVAKPRNTAIMIAAALLMTRAVAPSPRTTASLASPVTSQASRTRDSRNTS